MRPMSFFGRGSRAPWQGALRALPTEKQAAGPPARAGPGAENAEEGPAGVARMPRKPATRPALTRRRGREDFVKGCPLRERTAPILSENAGAAEGEPRGFFGPLPLRSRT